MPIGSIISQPNVNGLNAAYRPVILRVRATNTDNTAIPPVVHCDIYFNSIYYKTISKTQYSQLNLSNTEWQFDIQDAAQEFLTKYLGTNGEPSVAEATPIITACYCRFRSSGIDDNGFIESEDTAPVQGTNSSDPVSGTGFESNTFYILNATLQHEDAQDISIHLNSFKRRTWADATYPLSHRPDNYKLCGDDSDVFPIVHDGDDLACLVLNYRNRGQDTWNAVTNCSVLSCPIPADVEIFVIDNGDGTQTFTFDWSNIPAPTAQLDIQSRPANSTVAWTSHIGSINPTTDITLPIGLYDFRVMGVGDCASVPSAEFEDYGIGVCNPVIRINNPPDVPAPDIPDAQAGVAYDFTVYFTGTPPIALSNVNIPSWMTATVIGMTVKLTGTPGGGDVGEGIAVAFDVTNCSGANTQPVEAGGGIIVSGASPSTFFNNSASPFAYKILVNGDVVGSGSVLAGQTVNFIPPELPMGAGVQLVVYTSTFLMTTCTAQSNSVNIPMVIDTSGPGTNNIANNLATFAIVNGLHIIVT